MNLEVRFAAMRFAIGLAFRSSSSSPELDAAVRTARQEPENLHVRLSGDRESPS